jgi:hypothetical protein
MRVNSRKQGTFLLSLPQDCEGIVTELSYQQLTLIIKNFVNSERDNQYERTFSDAGEILVNSLHGDDDTPAIHLSDQHLHDQGGQRKRHVEQEIGDEKCSCGLMHLLDIFL